MIAPSTDRRQSDGWSCGVVAASTALELIGYHRDCATDYPKRYILSTPLDGTDPRILESFFRREFLRVISGDMSVVDLKFHVDLGRPVVCLIQFGGTGHWVTVYRVTRAAVKYHDPAKGFCKLSPAKFRAIWYDRDRNSFVYRGFGVAVFRPEKK